MQHYYDGQLRRYLTQFMRMMSLFSYKDAKGKLTQIPVRYGDMNRQVANVLKKNSENIMQSAPFIACYIKDVQFDRARMQDPTFVSKINVRERAFDEDGNEYLNHQGANYTVERLMPAPYSVTFAADVWASNFDQKLQIFEQIAMLFTPSFEIQTTDNYLDWTSLSVLEIESMIFESRTIPQGLESDISVTNLVFKAPIWISPPSKVKKLGIITKISANIFTEPAGSGDAGLYQDAGYADIFGGQTPAARVVVTPESCELLVLDHRAKLLPIKQSIVQAALTSTVSENRTSWLSVLDLYPGQFKAGISQLRLTKPDGNEIVAYISLDPYNEAEMVLSIDTDTIPSNTSIADISNTYSRGTVDAIIDPLRYNPGTPAIDTRYIILEDINPDASVENYNGPAAWKNADQTDFIAHANDIIQWNGTAWNVIFQSSAGTEITYITNSYTGIQYKWDAGQWNKSYDGVYDMAAWRLVL